MDCGYVCVYKRENKSYLQLKMILKHKGACKLTNYFLKQSNVELANQVCAPFIFQVPSSLTILE